MTHSDSKNREVPSFGVPIAFFIAAALAIVAKELIVGSMMQSSSGGLAGHMATLDSVENVVGASYIIAGVLGLIGAALLIRAVLARSTTHQPSG